MTMPNSAAGFIFSTQTNYIGMLTISEYSEIYKSNCSINLTKESNQDHEKYITAMLLQDQDKQKEFLERNKQLHAYMSPFINWVPTQEFKGQIVEYGPLIQLLGCDPQAPKGIRISFHCSSLPTQNISD